jgi:hypothetical protein
MWQDAAVRLAALIVLMLVPLTARAECPTTPDDPVCRPWSAILVPTAFGGMFAPRRGPTFFGGGVEAILIAWSDNSEAFGPSQGRVRIDFALYEGNGMDAGALVMSRSGAQVTFERNASRAYGIPYFATDIGWLWSKGTGRRWFVDAGVGIYFVHKRSFIIDAEVTGVLPFSDPDSLAGVSTRLGVSFALW